MHFTFYSFKQSQLPFHVEIFFVPHKNGCDPKYKIPQLEKKIYTYQFEKRNLEAINFKEPTKLTESFQPCQATCHVETAQLQNCTETDIK